MIGGFMRKTNTFKKIFIITALVLSLGLVTFGVSRIKRADAALITDTDHATGDYITITYEVYDYDGYVMYTDINAMINYALEEGYDLIKKKKGSWALTDDYADYANDIWNGTEASFSLPSDPTQTGYQKYGKSITDILGSTPTVDPTTGKIQELEALKVELTTVEQNQKIVVAVFAEASGGKLLNGGGVSMSKDLHGAASYLNFSYSYDDKPNWGTSYVGTATVENDSYTGTSAVQVIKLGGQDTSSTSTGYGGKQFLGSLGYQIKGTFSGSLDLTPIGGSSTFFVLQGGSGKTAASADNHTYFVVNAPSFTVEGVDNTDGKLKSITINTGSSPYTVDNTSGPIATTLAVPSANQPAATKTSVSVSVVVNSTGCTYAISYGPSSSGPWTSSSSGTVNLENPGSSTYVKI